jgi:hypothetical protein
LKDIVILSMSITNNYVYLKGKAVVSISAKCHVSGLYFGGSSYEQTACNLYRE